LDPFCDITTVDPSLVPDHDVLLGGFPCQAFSAAGQKKGFDDIRGTLFFDVAKILAVKKPKALLLENVRGLISHDSGRTLQRIIGVLDDLGYKVDKMILNSKDFGVPQNRPRIYIVAIARVDGESADDIFKFPFPKPIDSTRRLCDILHPNPVDEIYYLSKAYWATLLRHKKRHAAKGQGFGYLVKTGDDIASTIMCGGMGKERNLIFDESDRPLPDWANSARLRKMTPVEWERLQGFPDGWSDAASLSSRWGLLGNSVTVNVIEAISKQILKEIAAPTGRLLSIFG
jgi:DNA (cytosine-5)-methyltransferase 1